MKKDNKLQPKAAIEVKNVSKHFKLPHERKNSLKQHFVGLFSKKLGYEKFEALKDISFTVNEGDFFGIVGRNGSGKSTLLKIISGIYQPSSGSVKINGTLTPFIELGIGFNPELTGRENVYLNGSILGLTKKQIDDLYDEIVEFAELEKFMDQKLKNYSSGMQVRLAFSIAIRAQNNILLLDEVLAVGDINFQKKCFNYFNKLKREKKTVIFISHDMSAIQKFCNKAVLLVDSEIKFVGSADDIASMYYKEMNSLTVDTKDESEQDNATSPNKDKHAYLSKASIKNKQLKYAEPLEVAIEWGGVRGVSNIGVAIFNNEGVYIHGNNSIIKKTDYGKKKSAKITYKNLFLNEGEYNITVGLFGDNDSDVIELHPKAATFSIFKDKSLKADQWQGIVNLNSDWS